MFLAFSWNFISQEGEKKAIKKYVQGKWIWTEICTLYSLGVYVSFHWSTRKTFFQFFFLITFYRWNVLKDRKIRYWKKRLLFFRCDEIRFFQIGIRVYYFLLLFKLDIVACNNKFLKRSIKITITKLFEIHIIYREKKSCKQKSFFFPFSPKVLQDFFLLL